MTDVLEVDAVTVRYGAVVALREASLSIGAGRVCGLIGMNGSGKSTLFKAIMGLLRADTGRILIDGGTPARARKD
ncbi:ATP-binding cassette domain-containing protein, partial [Mycolicibacterium sphagni]